MNLYPKPGDLCTVIPTEDINFCEELSEVHIVESACLSRIEICVPRDKKKYKDKFDSSVNTLIFDLPERNYKITHRPIITNPMNDGEWTGIIFLPIELLNEFDA